MPYKKRQGDSDKYDKPTEKFLGVVGDFGGGGGGWGGGGCLFFVGFWGGWG